MASRQAARSINDIISKRFASYSWNLGRLALGFAVSGLPFVILAPDQCGSEALDASPRIIGGGGSHPVDLLLVPLEPLVDWLRSRPGADM